MPTNEVVPYKAPNAAHRKVLGEIQDENEGKRRSIRLPHWDELTRALNGGFGMNMFSFLYGLPGSGKSWAAIVILLLAMIQGFPCQYFTLEDSRSTWLRKILAARLNSWKYLESLGNCDNDNERKALADFQTQMTLKHASEIDGMEPYLTTYSDIIKPTADMILNDLKALAASRSLMIVDNMRFIHFGRGLAKYEAQSEFVAAVANIVKHNPCHIILVNHENQRGGMFGSCDLGISAHNVLRWSRVGESVYGVELVKCRNAKYSNNKLFFMQKQDGPWFYQLANQSQEE